MTRPSTIAARIRRWDTEGPQGPVTLELYPTLKCNLDCLFCDTTERHQPRQNELPLSRHLEILDEAAELGVQRVFVLGGGEPLVARDLTPPILRRVKQLGMEGILTTNGTILPAGLREQLLEDLWDELHVSVDGPTAEIHDHLRGQKGAFRKTVTNLCRLNLEKKRRGLSHPRLALHTVLTNTNYRSLSDMVRLGRALGVFRIDFDALVAYRPEQLALKLSPAQAEELPEGEGLKGAPCLKAWHYLVVQADGRTSPCCVLAGMGESVAQTPLSEVWNQGDFLASVRTGMASGRPLKRCSECSPNILVHEAAIRAEL